MIHRTYNFDKILELIGHVTGVSLPALAVRTQKCASLGIPIGVLG